MKPFFLILSACFAVALSSQAAHPFLCCDYQGNKVAVVSADGKIEWEYACPNPQDCWRLPSGNYLFCHVSGALETTPDKKTVWEYKAPEKTEVHACQPITLTPQELSSTPRVGVRHCKPQREVHDGDRVTCWPAGYGPETDKSNGENRSAP